MHNIVNTFMIIGKGIPNTLIIVFFSAFCGVVIAIINNLLKQFIVFKSVIWLYITFFRGTPLFLQLFLVYYGLGSLLPLIPESFFANHEYVATILKSPFMYVLLAMTLNTGAYGSKIVEGAINAVDHRQIESAASMGFSRLLIVKRIILPQAFFYALQPYGTEFILQVKASSLVSLFTIMDITGYMNKIRADEYNFFLPFIVASTYYMIISYSIIFVFRKLESRFVKWKPINL